MQRRHFRVAGCYNRHREVDKRKVNDEKSPRCRAGAIIRLGRVEGSMSTPINPNRTTVLTSWKEIARYLGKGVRTVQRWEEDFGLPIRRPHSANKKAVLARPRDLDAWVAMRCSTRTTLSLKADGDDRAEEHQVSSAFMRSAGSN